MRNPVLLELYDQFLADEDSASFIHRSQSAIQSIDFVALGAHGHRYIRRASILAGRILR